EFDIQKQCQQTQRATDELTGTKNPGALDLCVKSEQSAREKLAERWATTSALDKASCIHPADWSPSYFEWLGCLDTREYMRTQRKDHPESMAASKLCPKVNWQSDGSITSVVACQDRNSLADRMENINARSEIIGIRRNSVHCFGTG
ncbi:MAG: hypothetical protein WBF50_08525, partial [Pseudolabrys sp.]